MHAGLGVRPELFEPILELVANRQQPSGGLGFVEAHSENYFGDSIARAKLLELRQHIPVSLHGVGLSLGRADNLDYSHLAELKDLVAQVEPVFVSEHLAWSAYSHRHLPDLLPLPLTDQALSLMCQHVDQMQSALGRQIFVENPSNYLLFDQLQIPETEFLNSLAERTGCGLLVDVNNIHVSAHNTGNDAIEYLETLNSKFIGQYHLAGYTEVDRQSENLLIDTHNQTVYPQVWTLFEKVLEQHGARPTIFEWDSDFPEFAILLEECEKANELLAGAQQRDLPKSTLVSLQSADPKSDQLSQFQDGFLDGLLAMQDNLPQAVAEHGQRFWVYQNNVYAATREYLEEVFPAFKGVVGDDFFKQLAQRYIQADPSATGNIHLYGSGFADYVAEQEGITQMVYVPDLVEYEWALHQCYFASSGLAVDPATIPQEQLLSMPLGFNPSVWLLNSDYPIYQIHRQSLPDYLDEVNIDLSQSQDKLLIYKNHHAVMVRVLTTEESIFFEQFENCENLLQAIEGVQGSISAEAMSAALATMFELNLLSAA